MRGKLRLENTFHNTETHVLVMDGVVGESAMKRAKRRLCGMSDCTCGQIRGTVTDALGERYHLEEMQSGDYIVFPFLPGRKAIYG